MFSNNWIPRNVNLINRSINNKEDSTEDFEEEKVEALVEEEDEVVNQCNVKLVEYWDTIRDISCNWKCIVHIVLLLTTPLIIVHSWS